MQRRLAVSALVLALAVLALPGAAAGRRVRVFAVGPRITANFFDTREHFRAKLLALVDRRLRRTAGTPEIQQGADDVHSHLRREGANLVLLPEDVGLPAALVGSRGAAARRTPPSALAAQLALVALQPTYAPQISFYGSRYLDLPKRQFGARLLALSLTDTFGRTAVETFAEIARREQVWLEAGVDMARSWRVVCTNRATFRPPPGVQRCDVQDPARVALLRDPDEPRRNYAYEATTPAVSNMALVFDPRGRLRAKVAKAYLTPIELPGNLDLVPGDVDGVAAVKTPVGTLGFVTSKDAWMPDVTAKLDARGVDLLIQPEFFVGDTLRTKGMWAADGLKAAGWSDVMRHPSIDAMVLPELTGNFFSFGADAQQHIVVKPRGRRFAQGRLAGQPRAPGFLRVAPYLAPDPTRASFAVRRQRLGAAGEKALVGGPACPRPDVAGPCANGMRETVTWADVTVGARRRYHRRAGRGRTAFAHALRISPSRFGQRNVDLAQRGRTVVAGFEERGRVVVVASADAGRTWGRRIYPGKGPRQWWPQVALGPDGRAWVTWQDDRNGRPRVHVASGPVRAIVGSRRGRVRTGPPTAVLGRARAVSPVGAPQWRPTIAATNRGRAYAAWIDERERSDDDGLPQAHVYGARVTSRGAGPARRLDGGAPAELAAKLGNSWAPDLAARNGRLLLTWVDFHTYDWRPYARESRDGGAAWSAEHPLASTPVTKEALDDTPRGALTAAGPLVAWTDFRKRDSLAPHPIYDIYAAKPGGAHPADHRVDLGGPLQSVSFAPTLAPDGRGAFAAWQDMRAGPGRILLTHLDPRGRPGRPVRVDDGGSAGWNSWRPAIAAGQGRVLTAWEDERDGPTQILAAGAPIRALPR